MWIEALGWAAAAFGSLVALPQVVKLFQTGAAAGVSLSAWQASFGANIAWTVHGVLGGYTNLWVPNVIFFCCSTLIWVTWAALAGESSVILVGSSLGVLMAMNLCWAVLRRLRLVRARLADMYA